MEFTVYRAVFSEYANDPLPSRSQSGRFHGARNGPMTTYLAESPRTAWREVTVRWRAQKAAYRMVHVEANLNRVLDLTESAVQLARGIDARFLVAPEYPPCQLLAETIRSEGFEAIRTYSAADYPAGRQLVVFLNSLDATSSLSVVAIRDVEGSLRKWSIR